MEKLFNECAEELADLLEDFEARGLDGGLIGAMVAHHFTEQAKHDGATLDAAIETIRKSWTE